MNKVDLIDRYLVKFNKDDPIFILHSGGLDSTFLVEYLLFSGFKVRTGYVSVLNNNYKTVAELDARTKQFHHFRSLYPNSDIYDYGSIFDVTVNHTDNTQFLEQPLFWTSALHFIKEKYACIAYVEHDCAVSWLNEIQNLFYSFDPFKHHKTELVFPLIKISKAEIICNININLLATVWWCEIPTHDIKPCGKCCACVTHSHFSDLYERRLEDLHYRLGSTYLPICNDEEYYRHDSILEINKIDRE